MRQLQISPAEASPTDGSFTEVSIAKNFVADDAMLPHFVRYGAALLRSPVASSNCDDETEIALDYENLRLAIGDLCAWLELLKLVPRQVLLLEDFDSQIIGRAIALQLDVSHKIVDDASYTRSKSLIVSADSRHLTSAVLRVIFPGQVLYALNLQRASGAIAPDVSSLSQPKLLLPWHEQQLTSRKVSSLAERVSNAPLPASGSDWPARLEFYRARRAYLTAGNSVFHRSPMLPESF